MEDLVKKILERIEVNQDGIENFNLSEHEKFSLQNEIDFLNEVLADLKKI